MTSMRWATSNLNAIHLNIAVIVFIVPDEWQRFIISLLRITHLLKQTQYNCVDPEVFIAHTRHIPIQYYQRAWESLGRRSVDAVLMVNYALLISVLALRVHSFKVAKHLLISNLCVLIIQEFCGAKQKNTNASLKWYTTNRDFLCTKDK